MCPRPPQVPTHYASVNYLLRSNSASSLASSSHLFRANSASSTSSSLVLSQGPSCSNGHGGSVRKQLKDLFTRCDVDRSGGLNRTEFTRLLERCSLKQVSAGTIFSYVDMDGDGEVDFEEFVEWIESPDTAEGPCRGLLHVTAADRVLRYVRSTLADSRIAHNTNSRVENLQKRFPSKDSNEIERVLFRANNHGGEAAAVLSGKVERLNFKTTKFGTQYMSELGGTAGHFAHMYGL